MARVVASIITIALLAVPLIGTPAAGATPKCQGFKATWVGTNGADVFKGTAKRDVVVAKGGADKIYGRGGADIICAGKGKDFVNGGAGNDKIYGGDKNDVLKGGSGWDLLNGGKGKDACYTQADGGKKIACEEADLKVTVEAPATVVADGIGGDTFDAVVWIRNIGAKAAKDVVVDLYPGEVMVDCIYFVPQFAGYAKLVPGEYQWLSYPIDCKPPAGSPGLFTLKATGSTSSYETNGSNNLAESQTTVEKAP